MTALDDAERTVAEAREALLARIHEPETGIDLIANLIAAVREHAVVKAEAEVHGCCDECNAAMQIARNAILPTRCACEQHTDNETCLGPA